MAHPAVPSPEIEALVRRVLEAWESWDLEIVRNLFSSEAELRVIGFDEDEWWVGPDAFFGIFRTQAREVPTWRYEIRLVEAFEQRPFGWASIFGTMHAPETDTPMRHVAVLRLEAGAWRVVQWINAIPVANRQIFGVELTQTLDDLVSSVLDDDQPLAVAAGLEGTMTLVFTDIVDSTSLAESFGDVKWADYIASHESTIRRLTNSERGTVVKMLGDGSMLAFQSARAAVRAALAIQRSTASVPFKVRVGIHTGEVIQTGGDLLGVTVNKAARIAATAGANEIMASSTTSDMIGSLEGVNIKDHGLIALKGLSGRHQLVTITRENA